MTKLKFVIVGLFLCFGTALHSRALKPSLNQKCLAYAVFREARGESKKGQIAVGEVIKNRIRAGLAKSACEIVKQSGQFGFNVRNPKWSANSIPIKSQLYFYKLAAEILETPENKILPENVLFFNNRPFKSSHYHLYAKIGHQLFYTLKEQ